MGCLMQKLPFFIQAAVCFGCTCTSETAGMFLELPAAFGMELPVSRWDSCSIEENHEGDCSFQATLFCPAVLAVITA